MGHNWGSQHDIDTPECNPPFGRNGGKYIMYASVVSGNEPNNKVVCLSVCLSVYMHVYCASIYYHCNQFIVNISVLTAFLQGIVTIFNLMKIPI